jgi:hypothetical protein
MTLRHNTKKIVDSIPSLQAYKWGALSTMKMVQQDRKSENVRKPKNEKD